jgi:hypothetical protein
MCYAVLMTRLENPVATLRVVAIPQAMAARIRAAMRDDYGNDLTAEDGEGAPCRVCLRYGRAGEPVILFSYKPFDAPALYQEVGPVFIHADRCPPYPSDAGVPEEFANRPLIVRPYSADHRIADSQVFTQPGEVSSVAARLLENPEAAYLHVRSISRGCFLFRLERP